MTFVFACSSVLVALTDALWRRGTVLALGDWRSAVAFAIGESGSTVFFLLACRSVAPAEANLIIFLWPGFTVGIAAALGAFRLRKAHVAGITVGLLGVAALTGVQFTTALTGVGWAILGSLCWTAYCVYRIVKADAGPSNLSLGFALCAALCAALHLSFERWVSPDSSTGWIIVLIALLPTAASNLFWDYGLRRGDARLLAVLSYATPLGSALLLTALRFEHATWHLAVGGLLIVAAGLLSKPGSTTRSS